MTVRPGFCQRPQKKGRGRRRPGTIAGRGAAGDNARGRRPGAAGREGAMAADQDFADVMARLRAGDEVAAQEVFGRYAHRLIALARSRLGERLRPKVDAEDVVQSVFKSFFVRYAEDRFDLGGWDGLWSLLTVITLRKCGYRTRYF